MTSENPANFQIRGHRVPAMDAENIEFFASRICKIFKATKHSFSPSKIETFFQRLEEDGVNIDIIDDADWPDVARATVDPASGFIYMPGELYRNLTRSQPEALRIFLHELGHIFLCHRPLMHFTDQNALETEDSEWQADTFADCVIDQLKLPRQNRQLEFKNF